MLVVRTVSRMQKLASEWKRAGIPIGFVPTMGYLHRGHASLIQRARHFAGPRGKVIVSIYVNPAQFSPTEDLSKYPRDLKRDRILCQQGSADALFLPSDEEIYPSGRESFSTYVVEESLSRGMEGQSRPTHFRGVTTVVAKLFNIVQPDRAIFGAKDFQQAAIVRRMVRDLNFNLRVEVAPTIRETDGLAMSSRNKYLSTIEREEATILWKSIAHARNAIRANRILPAAFIKSKLRALISRCPSARLDYIELFDPDTLQPVTRVQKGTQIALAVFIGKTRLIDNARI